MSASLSSLPTAGCSWTFARKPAPADRSPPAGMAAIRGLLTAADCRTHPWPAHRANILKAPRGPGPHHLDRAERTGPAEPRGADQLRRGPDLRGSSLSLEDERGAPPCRATRVPGIDGRGGRDRPLRPGSRTPATASSRARIYERPDPPGQERASARRCRPCIDRFARMTALTGTTIACCIGDRRIVLVLPTFPLSLNFKETQRFWERMRSTMEQPHQVNLAEDGTSNNGPRSVEHEYTLNWAPILRQLGASLLISTYQAGKVVVVGQGSSSDELVIRLSCHNFERAWGLRSRRDDSPSAPGRWSGSSGRALPSPRSSIRRARTTPAT